MSVKTLAARMQYLGENQNERIKRQKLRSFEWALKNDYNARRIATPKQQSMWAIITNNTSGLKADYDKKYVSVSHDAGLEAGDVFRILDDDTYWMIYLPILTETAYLRSEIVRCRYTLDVNGTEYWCYIQGPTETDLRWFMKNNINVNELNLSGTIYIKNDENTKNYFKRFTKLKIDGHVWEVQVTDSISVPGILELEIQEYYDNTIEELPEIKVESEIEDTILGETTVKQDVIVGYTIIPTAYDENATWTVTGNPRVKLQEILEDGRMCRVRVYPGAIKTFNVNYGDYSLEVTVDWAKPVIQGPQDVFPYDTDTYWLKNIAEDVTVTFDIDDTSVAEIVEIGNDYCKVEIITGRKGNFTLTASYEDNTYTLPVTINSL